jgi:hypothetical protein
MKAQTLAKIGVALIRRKWRQSPLGPKAEFDADLRAAGLSFGAWLEARRRERRQYVELAPAEIEALKAAHPGLVESHVEAAERVLAHRFDLLGSGPYVPAVDGELVGATPGYKRIDWFRDPVRAVSFRSDVPYKEWKLFEMRPENADVKFPWELGRCQHFAVLGQAFLLTGEDRFAVEIIDEIEDFTAANPVGIGVNWTCTMDVALRAANWALGLALIKNCRAIDDARFHRAYRSLYAHGEFIFANFENTYEVTSNHYLSNVVGLHFLAAEFGGLKAAAGWDAYCRKSLEEEIVVQILPDGADFESSVPYHRLVSELFLGCWRLAQLQGRPLSQAYRGRLADMVDYLAGVQRPDGLMPVFGDADDGRLHIFTDYGSWNPQDGRHIFAPASATLEEDRWQGLGGAKGAWEAAWWGFGGIDPAPASPADHVRLFPEAGAFVAREAGNYLLVTNSIVGTKGFGNHKHNEQLSFEYHFDGTPFVVDPGSYVYTSDFAARNLFRSTAYHSTLEIDGVEQNEFNPEWLFRMFEKAEAEHTGHGQDGAVAWYEGLHHGYERLEPGVTHRRRFEFDTNSGRLLIRDTLSGAGSHDLRWHFHLAPGVMVKQGDGAIELQSGRHRVTLRHPAGLVVEVSEAWYSPSYGRKVATQALDLTMKADVGNGLAVEFSLEPKGR